MQIYTGSGTCSGCHSCYNVCTQNAIIMMEDQEGFLYPKIDQSKCIQCGLCQKVCKVMECKNIEENVQAFSCVNKNDEIRVNSSSGGLFSAIAEAIINMGGVVFGAAYADDFTVRHICVNNITDLSKLRGSKYVQSTIGDVFSKVKSYLEQDKYVFFAGTPCQVNGLLSYLKKSYDKLYTQDIICHGVGSPLVWRKYLSKRIEDAGNSDILSVSMRDKTYGWRRFYMRIDFINGTRYHKRQDVDTYLNGFICNLFLRPSCYKCEHKHFPRNSDFTIADFWNIDVVMKKNDDNIGTSLMLINTEKGRVLFEQFKGTMLTQKVRVKDAIEDNFAVLNSVPEHSKRKFFFSNIEHNNIDKQINCCLNQSLKNRLNCMLRKIKRVIR